ncbi:hypothetical protein MNBD_GAMMA12-671 [hydrothermal vent metagenome]|uniref:FAD dependent oxidoreductase domain-containing protein n=1 Tax=hydrothermal vent metagenome TaxID=652676 RepID=A0A3B0Z5E4_9ZZZZ
MNNRNTPQIYDFTIVGQGLAGSILAYELLKYNKTVLVIDDNHKSASSSMAAGIINPITGMRFVKTSHVEILLPAALTLYHQLEKILKTPLLHHTQMIRLLHNRKEAEQLEKRIQDPAYHHWLGQYHPANTLAKFNDEFGSIDQLQSSWLDVPQCLSAIRHWLQSCNPTTTTYLQGTIDDANIKIIKSRQGNIIRLQSLQDEKIQPVNTHSLIYCRGYKDQFNHFFKWLPFQCAKGEILSLRANKALPPTLVNFGQWLIPIDPFTIKTGASWDRESLNQEITAKARIMLLNKIKVLYNIPGLEFEVIDQQAGVRPCTKHRTPFIGSHPEIESIKIFNGFGAKGSLLVPYFAKEFAKELCHTTSDKQTLLTECDIKRYWHGN